MLLLTRETDTNEPEKRIREKRNKTYFVVTITASTKNLEKKKKVLQVSMCHCIIHALAQPGKGGRALSILLLS